MSIRRDYKPASAWQRRRQAVRRHGLLVVTLILIGLFGGLLAYIRKGDQQPSVPAATAPTQPPSAPATVATPKPVPQTVAPLAPVKPKYDFYTELPKRQIDIRREEHKPQGIPPKPPARPQPAANLLRKPTAPKKNTAPPTGLLADRAIARHRPAQIGFGLVANLPAVAAARIYTGLGHFVSPLAACPPLGWAEPAPIDFSLSPNEVTRPQPF